MDTWKSEEAYVFNTPVCDDETTILIAVYRGFWDHVDMELNVDVIRFAQDRGISTHRAFRTLEEAQSTLEGREAGSLPEDVHEDDLHAAHELIERLANELLEKDCVPPGCSVWFDGLCEKWRWSRPYNDRESDQGIRSHTHGGSFSRHEAILQCKNALARAQNPNEPNGMGANS